MSPSTAVSQLRCDSTKDETSHATATAIVKLKYIKIKVKLQKNFCNIPFFYFTSCL